MKGSALTLGAAIGYNAFILGDFTEYNTDSEGKIAVAGNFAPANGSGFTVASHHASDPSGVYDLIVGGNLTNKYYSLGGGDVFVGGNLNWTDPTMPHNVYVNGNFVNSVNGGWVGGTIYYGGTYSSGTSFSHVHVGTPTASPIDFVGAQTNLTSVSNTLASTPANGTVSVNWGTYTLTGTSSSLNVFNLSNSSFNGATINITAPAGSTVIVNVAGTADSFNGGSINLNGVSSKDVIFNFSTASTLALSNISFNGTILAPGAAFTGSWGQINGQLIAKRAAGTTELHDALFSGNLTTLTGTQYSATPEPGTWWLLVCGVTLIAVSRKRSTSRD
jgi:choice-of-anchor A domain-containing protein